MTTSDRRSAKAAGGEATQCVDDEPPEESARRSLAELRALSERLRQVREEESARIAREVHDEVGQMLTALRMDIAWLEKRVERLSEAVRAELSGKLRAMGELLDTTVEVVQRIVTELRPFLLGELGLEAAVEAYVAGLRQRTGIECDLRFGLRGVSLDPDRSTTLFRILQEALTNVVRHAAATRVGILLAREEGRIVLRVSDDGAGIPEDKLADSRSLGLVGMRERARSLGGDLAVYRNRERGTTVEASLPA